MMIQKLVIRIFLKTLFCVFPKSFTKEIRNISPHLLQDMWVTQALNGQAFRTSFISRVIEEIQFDWIIETGTFLGNSTLFLSTLSETPLITIDVNEGFSRVAKERFVRSNSDRKIEFKIGKSEVVLREILSGIQNNKTLFFYLDAHWESNLPLKEELLSVIEWGGNFVAIIDDFYIPNDPGYGYDLYGDKIVGYDEIPKSGKTELYTLNCDSKYETGARRGTGILISKELSSTLSLTTQSKLKLFES